MRVPLFYLLSYCFDAVCAATYPQALAPVIIFAEHHQPPYKVFLSFHGIICLSQTYCLLSHRRARRRAVPCRASGLRSPVRHAA